MKKISLITALITFFLLYINAEEIDPSNFETLFEYNMARQDEGLSELMTKKAKFGINFWNNNDKKIKEWYIGLLNPTNEEFQNIQIEYFGEIQYEEYNKENFADFRGEIIHPLLSTGSAYPFDNSDEILDFILYMVKNEPSINRLHDILRTIRDYAFNGSTKAKDYILALLQTPNHFLSIKIHLHCINLAFGKNDVSFNFLRDLIIEAQNVENTDVAYITPVESIISREMKIIPNERYSKGNDFDDVLSLYFQLLHSRCKGLQEGIVLRYHYYVTPKTIENRVEDLWKIIEDNSFSRTEYVNALYELQAYNMLSTTLSKRRIPQFSINLNYDKIRVYFTKMVNQLHHSGSRIYDVENSEIKEDRIIREEKIYFYERLGYYSHGKPEIVEKYKFDEPAFRFEGGRK
ncbi:MAG: hypothetical protein ISS80_05005 [Candidatus Cloacimonetes bacterium]|nr:hypothetical protein [Candidatus Cloacimonadota bacterium]